jgi:hypothetical protein
MLYTWPHSSHSYNRIVKLTACNQLTSAMLAGNLASNRAILADSPENRRDLVCNAPFGMRLALTGSKRPVARV